MFTCARAAHCGCIVVRAFCDKKDGGTIMVGRSNIPAIFFTNVRKVEPMGSDCVRIYCSVVRDGEWVDKLIVEMPISGAINSSNFVAEAAADLFAGDKSAAST